MGRPVVGEATNEAGDDDVASAGQRSAIDGEGSASEVVDDDEADEDCNQLDDVHDAGEDERHFVVGAE